MAISQTTVWEVRAGAGNDNNGGGFVPGASGTDFSQQNAPQFALTGIASAGAGNIFLTASAAATMVGNLCQVISGTNFNVGFYQITAVSVGVSVTVSTNHTGGSISTGVGAAGVINIGGAMATMAATIAGMENQNQAYCTGTFTITTSLSFTINNNTVPMTFIGYGSVRGDTGRATWTSSTNSISICRFLQATSYLFQNIVISSTAGTRGNGFYASATANSTAIRVINCIFDGLAVGILGDFVVDFAFQGISLENCEVKNCTSHGIRNSGTIWVSFSFIHANTGSGMVVTSSGTAGSFGAATLFHSIFYSNGAGGYVDATDAAPPLKSIAAFNCAFSTNTGAGMALTGGGATGACGILVNCIFDRNTTYGLSAVAAVLPALGQWNLAFFNNTTAARNNQPAGFNDITLSADPYTSVGTDFSLNSTAGGGAACKQTGFPGVLIAGGTGFADVGALNPQASAGGTTIAIGKTNYVFLEGE